MRTIIAGSRSCFKMAHLDAALAACGWTPTVVLSGTASGADQLGEVWARENTVPIERYPALWLEDGPSAGMARNARMAAKADALIALWDGQSKGTRHMIRTAEKKGLRVHVHQYAG